jgi:diguanylate cyclase (GGDEF)-like protein
VISIKKLLDTDDTRLHVICALLEGIAQHSLIADPIEHRNFQSCIQGMADEINSSTTSMALLLMAGRAVKALEDYNSHATGRMGQQSTELSAIVDMLARTVTAISAAHGRSQTHLSSMQRDLKKASDIDDVRLLRIKIAHCLAEIELEAKEQQKEASATLESLRQEVLNPKPVAIQPRAAGADPVTGLPDRVAAEQALAEACRSPIQTYAALYVLDNVVTINRRFGIAVGDKALREFNRLIGERAFPADKVFRWSGPTFLALLQRTLPIEKVRSMVTGVTSRQSEVTVETESGSLMLPIYCHSTVFPMPAAPSTLIRDLDTFALASKS